MLQKIEKLCHPRNVFGNTHRQDGISDTLRISQLTNIESSQVAFIIEEFSNYPESLVFLLVNVNR